MNKYFLIVAIFLILAGCNKDKEIPDPVVSYNSPYENASFRVMDTVHVIAEVTASEGIKTIEVSLTNENMVTVLPSLSYTYTLDIQSLHLDLLYPIDEIRLESGNYFVLISVKTAHTSKNKYQKIILHEYPRELKGILLVQKENVNTTRLSLYDKNLQHNPLGLFPVDYGFAAVSSYDQMIYLAGHNVGDFYGFDVDSLQTRFVITGFNSTELACIQGLTTENGGVILSRSDEVMTSYSYYGKINSVFAENHPLYPAASFVYDNSILVNVLTHSGPESFLKMYYYPWGGNIQQKQIPYKIVKMFSPRAGEVLLFGNTTTDPVLQVYYPATQTTWSPLKSLPGKIISVCRADANNYFLATPQGVYWYQYHTQTITLFAPVTDAVGVAFEDVSEALVIARPLEFSMYSFPAGQKQMSSPLSDSLKAIGILYNK